MERKNQEFSQADLARIMGQPETKALLERLRQLDSNTLRNAVQQAMQGNTSQAQQLLTPLMQDPQVQDLTEKMRGSHGGI